MNSTRSKKRLNIFTREEEKKRIKRLGVWTEPGGDLKCWYMRP